VPRVYRRTALRLPRLRSGEYDVGTPHHLGAPSGVIAVSTRPSSARVHGERRRAPRKRRSFESCRVPPSSGNHHRGGTQAGQRPPKTRPAQHGFSQSIDSPTPPLRRSGGRGGKRETAGEAIKKAAACRPAGRTGSPWDSRAAGVNWKRNKAAEIGAGRTLGIGVRLEHHSCGADGSHLRMSSGKEFTLILARS